jgi:tetratricopeptide (TPR) repeat protein
LRIRERLGLNAGVATIQHHLGVIAFLEGNLDEAATMLTRSAAAWCDLGDRGWQANSLNYLGLVHRDRGDLDGAETTLLHALELRQGLSAQRAVAGLLFALGGVSLRKGKHALARDRFAESAEKRAALKLEEGTIEAVCGLGAALAALGRNSDAAAALSLAERLGGGELPEGARPFADEIRRLENHDLLAESPRVETVAELLASLR